MVASTPKTTVELGNVFPTGDSEGKPEDLACTSPSLNAPANAQEAGRVGAVPGMYKQLCSQKCWKSPSCSSDHPDAVDSSTILSLKQRVQTLETRNRGLDRRMRQLTLLRAHQRRHRHRLAVSACAELPASEARSHSAQQPELPKAATIIGEVVAAEGVHPPRTQEQDVLVLCRATSSSSQEGCDLCRACSSSSSSEEECRSLSRSTSSSSSDVSDIVGSACDWASAGADTGLCGRAWQQQRQQQQHEDAARRLQHITQQLQQQVAQQAAALQAAAAREVAYRGSIGSLQHELGRVQRLHQLLRSDYSDLEAGLKETERQRRDYAARYAFVVLDDDGDGYISIGQAMSYDVFHSYAPELLQAAFRSWRWSSGFPGFLSMDDFTRFVDWCEDRSSRAAQRFWFSVLDADGDGRLGWADCRQAYDAIDKSRAAFGFVVAFEDLMAQLQDMLGSACLLEPARGFTAGALFASKLGPGVLGLLTNHNNMLLQRSTAEWNRGNFPL